MTEALIRNWNSRVGPDDTVYHVGDFCTKGNVKGVAGLRTAVLEYEKRLNGKVVHIRGNHDANNGVKAAILTADIQLTKDMRVWVQHKPPEFDDFKQWGYEGCPYAAVVCGHVHEKWDVKQYKHMIPIVNVGVDVRNFMPMTTQELRNLIDRHVAKERS
jgi:calcineurin-like phosphoesterase family protein